eukprot:TRINITY_DN21530_c0_g1_i1.p1 TRINITY_DN21530_c0_g1~~TRINITY_DN21530_c0_g1_i1.p1  ORF type:complete len:268 (+),score=54.66 TRINITY_DN21530_c0_g1_i1:66-869(+)
MTSQSYIHAAAKHAFRGVELEQQHRFEEASRSFASAAELLLEGGKADANPRRQRAVRLRIAEYLTRAEILKQRASLTSQRQKTGSPEQAEAEADNGTTAVCDDNGDTEYHDAAMTCSLDNAASNNPDNLDTDDAVGKQLARSEAGPATNNAEGTKDREQVTSPATTGSQARCSRHVSATSSNDVAADASRQDTDKDDPDWLHALVEGNKAILASTAITAATMGHTDPNSTQLEDVLTSMPQLKYSQDEDEMIRQQYTELFGELQRES